MKYLVVFSIDAPSIKPRITELSFDDIETAINETAYRIIAGCSYAIYTAKRFGIQGISMDGEIVGGPDYYNDTTIEWEAYKEFNDKWQRVKDKIKARVQELSNSQDSDTQERITSITRMRDVVGRREKLELYRHLQSEFGDLESNGNSNVEVNNLTDAGGARV